MAPEYYSGPDMFGDTSEGHGRYIGARAPPCPALTIVLVVPDAAPLVTSAKNITRQGYADVFRAKSVSAPATRLPVI